MNTSNESGERAIAAENVLRIAALAVAVRTSYTDQQPGLHRQGSSFGAPPTAELDFAGPVPFGFAFTTGHRTPFYVPSKHRFVVEHVSVSCWADGLEVREVQLETRSRNMFRHMTLWDASEPSANSSSKTERCVNLTLEGSTANTLLFSDGAGNRWLQVPPDTYVQLWGYLEPTEDELSC